MGSFNAFEAVDQTNKTEKGLTYPRDMLVLGTNQAKEIRKWKDVLRIKEMQ